jgi:N-acetylglutamate synthase-like GNAT family acetyltransferase
MSEMLQTHREIKEFESQYQSQVLELIDTLLRQQGVIPNDSKKIDDEDLFHIPDVYTGRGKFWVAVENGMVVGTVAIRDTGGQKAKLNRMFVRQELHGTGLGQELLNTAISFAKQQGFIELFLNSHISMKRAHHFYEKNGFKKTGEKQDSYTYTLVVEN